MVPAVGTMLPNGAKVIEATSHVILAVSGGALPYVTWRWDGRDLRTTWSGNYFASLVGAVQDYDERRNDLKARYGVVGEA